MGTTVLVFEVELHKIHTTWIPFDFEPGLGRYSKWHVSGRWEKSIEKYIKYAIYIEISQFWRYGIKMEFTCHLWVSRTSLTSAIEGLGEEVELINTCMAVYVLHIRNKLSLISARKKLPSAIKVPLWSNSFYVSAEALFHGGPLVIRSERRSAKPKYPSLDPSDSQSPGIPERLGVLIFLLTVQLLLFK